MGARFVDEASSASGIMEDGVDGGVRKHRVVHASIASVGVDVTGDLCAIPVPQFALEVNALVDGLVRLKTEPVPQLGLSDESQSQRTLGVHPDIQELFRTHNYAERHRVTER